jgi:hypothetical protein
VGWAGEERVEIIKRIRREPCNSRIDVKVLVEFDETDYEAFGFVESGWSTKTDGYSFRNWIRDSVGAAGCCVIPFQNRRKTISTCIGFRYKSQCIKSPTYCARIKVRYLTLSSPTTTVSGAYFYYKFIQAQPNHKLEDRSTGSQAAGHLDCPWLLFSG